MKYIELTKEEEELLESFEKGEFKSVKNAAGLKNIYKKYAENTLNKMSNINIRLSEKVLLKLKAEAVREGLPYQTLASSVLHQFVQESSK
jgi:predicted DNA binding CopG/RHH family protein